MTDDDGGDGSIAFLHLQDSLAQRQKRITDTESRARTERLARLENRRDFVSNGRVVSGEQARNEQRAEIEDNPIRQAPSRVPAGQQIVNDPFSLRHILIGNNASPHPRVSDVKAMGQNGIIRSPAKTIALMGGTFRQPKVQPVRTNPHSRLDGFAAGLLGKKKGRR